MSNTNNWEDVFNKASEYSFSLLREGDVLNLNFNAEETDFVRLNKSKVRQVSTVEQASLDMDLLCGDKKASLSIDLSIDEASNIELLRGHLTNLQREVDSLPADPFITPLTNEGTSRVINEGMVPSVDEFVDLLGGLMAQVDLAGYLTSGSSFRGNANSLGQKHWFASTSFFFDYSLYTAKEKAIKGSYAGSHFDRAEFDIKMKESISSLAEMDKEQKVIAPGKYRVYLAPSAVSEISGMMGWHALSGGAYKRGECPLSELYEGKKELNEKFNLSEDFSLGLSPRFNDLGEVAAEKISLVTKGKMDDLLVSRSTEKEYGLKSNQATDSEGPRSLSIDEGDLKREDILKELGTGLYLSDLHYLNWSDKQKARLTGMTRFGCLWVEDGKVVGPIKDLRFDETLYQVFGEGLKAVTEFSDVQMTTGTYGNRSIGGSRNPGMIVENFSFTL
jgi:predicted Zn-dependent protease